MIVYNNQVVDARSFIIADSALADVDNGPNMMNQLFQEILEQFPQINREAR